MSDAKSMHSEPMKAQMAIFVLSRPVDVAMMRTGGGRSCVLDRWEHVPV